MSRSPITTHVLDTARGKPAAGIAVLLEINTTNGWQEVAAGRTDADGRVADLMQPGSLKPGIYRLTFDTSTYQNGNESSGFYPYVPVVFEIKNPEQHYHVPLLLSPFGYSTYRGS